MILSPYLPTEEFSRHEALKMLNLKPGEILYDIGCGPGDILIKAADEYDIRGVGIEIEPDIAKDAKKAIKEAGLEDRVKIIEDDVMDEKVSLKEADALFIYLTPRGLEILKNKLECQLRPACKVASIDFPIQNWNHVECREPYNIYLYRMENIHGKEDDPYIGEDYRYWYV